jgi:hypothetical protein
MRKVKRMQRCVSAAIVAASVCSISALAADPKDGAVTETATVAAATELARNQLARELQIDIKTIEALSTEAQTWADGSLGCGKPGAMAAQVITSGYEVTLKTAKGNYLVHTTAKNAVVCGAATQWHSHRSGLTQYRKIEEKIDAARADLAAKLSAPPNEIRMTTYTPVEWPDRSMGCSVKGEPIVKQTTNGFQIALRYKDREYIYHTDLDRVQACPPIETN